MADRDLRIGETIVTVDDTGIEATAVGDGTYLVTDGAKRWRVVVAGPPDDRWVFVNGRVARVEVVQRGGTRARPRSGAQDMTAPMPATVVKVLVEPGAHVEKGAAVVMLEAMKMELAVRAATAGVVRAVHCKPGELVQPGVPLVEIGE